MKAAQLIGPGRIELVDREPLPLETGQVRIAITRCGIRRSEVELWKGDPPITKPKPLGQEFGGIVGEIGPDVTAVEVGDYVAAWSDQPWGAAQEAVVEARNCVQVAAAEIVYPELTEPVALVLNSLALVSPMPGDHHVIVGGTGFMGLLTVQALKLYQPRSIIVAGRNRDGLGRARALGATDVVDLTSESLKDVVRRATNGRADVVWEATGVQAGLNLVWPLVRRSGTVAICGYHQSGGERRIPLEFVNRMAIQLMNCHFRDRDVCMPGMHSAMARLGDGTIDVSALVTHHFSLSHIAEAFDTAARRRGRTLKVIVDLLAD